MLLESINQSISYLSNNQISVSIFKADIFLIIGVLQVVGLCNDWSENAVQSELSNGPVNNAMLATFRLHVDKYLRHFHTVGWNTEFHRTVKFGHTNGILWIVR